MRRLWAPAGSVIDEVLPALVNDLVEVVGSLVLVIDDYHVIVDPEIHARWGPVSRLPLSIHVVLIAHAEPPLRLGRTRALAILERFSGPLADALTGRDDGAEALRELERTNLFRGAA